MDGQLSFLNRLAVNSLCLLAFVIPLENVVIPGVGLLGAFVGMIAAGLCVLAIVERGSVRPLRAEHMLMGVFVLWATVSYLWSLDPNVTLLQVPVYVRLLLMVWLIWQLCSKAGQQIRLLQAFLLGTVVAGMDTIYQFIRGIEVVYQRYAGVGAEPNNLGLVMALSVPMAYCLFIRTERRVRWLYVAQLVLAITTIFLTASRGAILAVAVALSIVPATAARLKRRQIVAVSLAAMLTMAAAVLFVPASSGKRLSTIPNELMGGESSGRSSMSGRSSIWEAGLERFREHPFLGVGAGAYMHSVRSSIVVPNVAHNTFLSVAVELGIVGLGIFCALLAVLFVSAMELPWLSKRLWLVCLAVWVVGVSSLTWEKHKPTWWLFGLVLAQHASLPRQPFFSRTLQG